jgi:hypothetical protein
MASLRCLPSNGPASPIAPGMPPPPASLAPLWTSHPAPRATTHAPHTHKQLQAVGGHSAESGDRAHHGSEGHRAPREEGAGGGNFPPTAPWHPRPRLGRRAPRPAQPPTHRMHTSNHKKSVAIPPCAAAGPTTVARAAPDPLPPTRPAGRAGPALAGAPATKHASADGGAGGAAAQHPPHSVRTTSPLQKHDTSTRRGAEAGTRRQTRKKRVGGVVPAKLRHFNCLAD